MINEPTSSFTWFGVCERVCVCTCVCVCVLTGTTVWHVICVKVTSHPHFSFSLSHTHTHTHTETASPVSCSTDWLQTGVTSQEGVPPASEEVCVISEYTCVCVCVCLRVDSPSKSTSGWHLWGRCRLYKSRQPGGRSEFLWGCTPCCTHQPPAQRHAHTHTHTHVLDKRFNWSLKWTVRVGVCVSGV